MFDIYLMCSIKPIAIQNPPIINQERAIPPGSCNSDAIIHNNALIYQP